MPHETLGYALKRAQQAMRSYMDRRLKEIGLTAPQYAVLATLEVEPGASNAALARLAFVTPQTMQVMLVKLEDAGFIERKPDADHGRIQRTTLTARGQTIVRKAHDIARQAEEVARDAASPDAVRMLKRVAEALA
ncbi:MarR family winged helix-turn-helix transcriptional regulator [Phaeobacter italicus]|uniref:MarR family winged helix-turn-helix transcriptional regulator n=1 Tax=Phaeobacter italicus TaxID=481446 RepID=UPI001FFE27E6|nr:MarR family transcriptional regulator [Phaeobacter italicus]